MTGQLGGPNSEVSLYSDIDKTEGQFLRTING